MGTGMGTDMGMGTVSGRFKLEMSSPLVSKMRLKDILVGMA